MRLYSAPIASFSTLPVRLRHGGFQVALAPSTNADTVSFGSKGNKKPPWLLPFLVATGMGGLWWAHGGDKSPNPVIRPNMPFVMDKTDSTLLSPDYQWMQTWVDSMWLPGEGGLKYNPAARDKSLGGITGKVYKGKYGSKRHQEFHERVKQLYPTYADTKAGATTAPDSTQAKINWLIHRFHLQNFLAHKRDTLPSTDLMMIRQEVGNQVGPVFERNLHQYFKDNNIADTPENWIHHTWQYRNGSHRLSKPLADDYLRIGEGRLKRGQLRREFMQTMGAKVKPLTVSPRQLEASTDALDWYRFTNKTGNDPKLQALLNGWSSPSEATYSKGKTVKWMDVRHIMGENETVQQVAQRYGVNAKDLRAINTKNQFKPGRLVTIPVTGKKVVAVPNTGIAKWFDKEETPRLKDYTSKSGPSKKQIKRLNPNLFEKYGFKKELPLNTVVILPNPGAKRAK